MGMNRDEKPYLKSPEHRAAAGAQTLEEFLGGLGDGSPEVTVSLQEGLVEAARNAPPGTRILFTGALTVPSPSFHGVIVIPAPFVTRRAPEEDTEDQS